MSDEEFQKFKEKTDRWDWIELAERAFTKLKMELAIRSDNPHVGSGLGGNVSELFFLMNHKIKFALSKTDVSSFERNGNEILFSVASKANMKQIRKALTEFYSNHPAKKDIAVEQIINPTYLKETVINPTIDIKLLIQALEIGLDSQKWLDKKLDLRNHLCNLSDEEHHDLKVRFLLEIGLPSNYFETLPKNEEADEYEGDPVGYMFKHHPVWGVRDEAVSKRFHEMGNHLLSQEDMDRINFIGACPPHITLLIFRALISLERVVALNLDEKLEFLSEIDKRLDQDVNEEVY